MLRSFCSGRNPSTVCFLPLSQIWPAGPFVQQEEPFGCVLLTFQDYDVLWSLGQGINSTKSVLFTLLGCLQVACRCRFDTHVLGTSGSSKSVFTIHASPSALSCHLYFRRIQILDQIRRRPFECGRLQITADYYDTQRKSTVEQRLPDAAMFTVHDSLPRSQISAFIRAFPHATAN